RVEVAAVLVDQVDGDRRCGGPVRVGVRLRAVGGVGVRVAVAPVHDVAGDRVGARIGNRAQGQAVARALVHTRRATDRDRGSDVVDGDRLGVGAIGEGAVLVDQVDGDRL